jgi:galactofuranosylgalactofuranosylrhamnosyl-N-acetylglucosaminyl-diphospho-decaprenol beta-1,5/1,6-galactofuranosyltransferase
VTAVTQERSAPQPSELEFGEGFRAVHRTIVRPDMELDVTSLYVGGVSGSGGGAEGGRRSGEEYGDAADDESRGTDSVTGMTGFGSVDAQGKVTVDPSRRVTFGTYFNAFPASYWRRWTIFESVKLRIRMRGQGTLIVYRSTSKGHVLRAESRTVDSEETQTFEIELSLKPFIDGGWYWFDLEAGKSGVTLEEAVWGVETDRTESGRVSVGITTFNRPDFCVAQLLNIAQDSEVREILDEVIVVDQGNQKIVDHPDYERAAAELGDQLRVIEQPNLGGSGGFSRAMSETVSRGLSDYVLLLDDDVVCELEGILRAVTFADLTKRPTLVGGHMFSLYDRSVMHAYGEAIARYRWFWGPAGGTPHGQDFSRQSLRSTPWLHRRLDVDYNGWWMCLIPTEVISEIGLSLPMFIKWDDSEFGIRAQAAGYPTVSLPGVAVWHVPWTEKDDTLDWQAYFHQRNRLISALMHSPYERGGKLVRESLENHVKRLMSMQYGTGEIILMALSDVLDGPDRMHHDIIHRLGDVRALRDQYDDGVAKGSLDDFPSPRRKKPPKRGRGVGMPGSRVGKLKMAVSGLAKQALPTRELAGEYPEAIVPHVDQRWYRLAHFDSAIVSSADGINASWYRRDTAQFRDQITRSAALHARLYKEWPELAARYREALPTLTSPEAWKPTFEGASEE